MVFVLEGSSFDTVLDDSTPHDMTLPGTPIEGDLIVYGAVSDQILSPGIQTSGYNNMHTTTTGSSPAHHSSYKMMGATPDTVISVQQDGNDQPVVILQTWSGVDTATPLDTLSSLDTTGGGMPNCPNVTLTGSDNLVLAMGFLDDDDVASSVTLPSGFTDLVISDGSASFSNTPSGNDGTIMCSAIKGAGTTDPAVYGGSGDDAWVAWTAGFNPLAAGGANPKGIFGMPFHGTFGGPI